ncbi:hypothetical protein L1887_50596 [Cichorium endivia]|nr:hypothetical protein L1887_50596 [Cichorium endivia]
MGEASSIHDCKGSHWKGQGRKDAAPATSIRTNARMPPAAVKIFRTAPKESSCVGMQLQSQSTNQRHSLLFAFSLSPSGMPPSSSASARSWLCATRWRHAPHSNGPFRLVCLAWLWFSSTFTTQEREKNGRCSRAFAFLPEIFRRCSRSLRRAANRTSLAVRTASIDHQHR